MRFDGWQFAEIMAYIFSDKTGKKEVLELVEKRMKRELTHEKN